MNNPIRIRGHFQGIESAKWYFSNTKYDILKRCYSQKMAFSQDGILKKLHFQEMTFSKFDILKRWHFQEMTFSKWHSQELTFSIDGILKRWYSQKMGFSRDGISARWCFSLPSSSSENHFPQSPSTFSCLNKVKRNYVLF